jgi:hypothetical protein
MLPHSTHLFSHRSIPVNEGKSDVDGEVKRLILGYMNGIQAIYMLPSLGRLTPRHSSREN